jgi:membrane associated rhomboid family serine protease
VDEDLPWVTVAAVAAVAYVAWQVTGFVPTEASLSPYWFSAEAMEAGEWHRLITSVFAHGGLLHLAFNVFAIVSLAGLEKQLGSPAYAVVFLAAGIGGNLAHVMVSPTPVVGASGAIFGLLGVLLAIAPGTRLALMGIIPVPAAIMLPGYAAVVLLVPGLEQLAPVAHFAHLGGLLVGLAAGASLAPTKALGNLAYAAVAFLGIGSLVVNVQAVGLGRLVEAASSRGLGGLLTLAWPSLVGLGLVGLVLHGLPDGQRSPAA